MEEILDDKSIMAEVPLTPVDKEEIKSNSSKGKQLKVGKTSTKEEVTELLDEKDKPFNCLTQKKVILRHINKLTGLVSNPKHILYGGMANNASRFYTVPQLSTGTLVNVLTDKEKKLLEEVMGLDYNALSVYKKENNFWENYQVELTKEDTHLNLADPNDYIKYKVLLCNKDFICPTLYDLDKTPKATYEFVIVAEGEEDSRSNKEINVSIKSFMEYGKIQEDFFKLKTILESLSGVKLSDETKLTYLQNQVYQLILSKPDTFYKLVTSDHFDNLVLITRAVSKGIISNRGGFYYIKESNTPMSTNKEDPTLKAAASFLANPKNQQIKFSIEIGVK